MEKLSIKDGLFSHAFSSSNWYKPTHFEWDFNNITNDFIFLTDPFVFKVDDFSKLKKYCWLVESPHVTPKSYEYVLNNGNKFDKIFTFDREILEKYNHSYLLPIGGCHLDEIEISNQYPKDKLISMMVSNKKFTDGHRIRYEILKRFNGMFDGYGNGINQTFDKKIKSTKDYKFSIVVENCKKDYYFTEKIIDVFLSGTIPIYWGCPSISKFFNTDGFLTFNSLDELQEIIKDSDFLNQFYNDKKNIIEENFTTALKYKICEDFLYTNYRDIL